MRRGHIPLRTCAGCGTKSSKRELTRIVRTLSGSVEVDVTGKKSGRGIYLCQQISCWETGVKKRRLGHALRHTVATLEGEALLTYAQQHFH